MDRSDFENRHIESTRRYFLQVAGGLAAASLLPRVVAADVSRADSMRACSAFLKEMPYLTPQEEFRNVSRGDPRPYTLSEEKKRTVGLTRDTWQLEIVSDPDNPAELGREFSQSSERVFDWARLMELAEEHSVSFAKVVTCNNIGSPLGMGIWEGVPLREVVWLTHPKGDLRRVHYAGYHNDDPKQIFRSSLPIGRVLEDPLDMPPVILCYKLNGNWLNGERGGPVRMVVPEAYGFKSVKWLNRLVLSNLHHANDTYAEQNNDIDSGMKTFARSMLKPENIQAGEPIPLTGYAQVGVSGLTRVQTCLMPRETEWPEDDPYFTKADWTDAHILPAPEHWGGDLPEGKLPDNLFQFNSDSGRPEQWPLRLTMAHWATVLPPQTSGKYTLRCRSIDAKGHAQPMPRPFRKSGRNVIEEVKIRVV
jgi:DMSO/TMAO reductase YedYZ molybdopterin-dependent catalytic subunit